MTAAGRVISYRTTLKDPQLYAFCDLHTANLKWR
jgi:hypothetical protein